MSELSEQTAAAFTFMKNPVWRILAIVLPAVAIVLSVLQITGIL
jgi:hypothetical protein